MSSYDFDLFGKSEVGNSRSDNQDRFLLINNGQGKTLLAIADGLGGEAAGSVAASLAVKYLEQVRDQLQPIPENLAKLLKQAGDEILRAAGSQGALRGMGTTLTAVQLHGHQAIWAHAGDSRLHHFHKGHLRQVTRDHRFLQDLIDSGEMTAEEALRHPLRNLIDQCLGSPDVQPDFGGFDLEPGDMLILTTDGLHDYVSHAEMARVLGSIADLPEMASGLMHTALSSGSADNLSIVLCRFKGEVEPHQGRTHAASGSKISP